MTEAAMDLQQRHWQRGAGAGGQRVCEPV